MRPNDDSSTDVKIADPDNYTTSQRLKQIYDARRDLRKMRREAAKVRNNPSNNQSAKIEAVQYYRSGLESYLLEVDTLLRQHDPGPELWHDRRYGSVIIPPPGDWDKKRGYYLSRNIKRGPNQPLKVESLPDPKEVPVTGLKWLFETGTPITRDFEFTVDSHVIDETVTKTGSAVVSWQTLNKMATDVNSFLNEVGVGLEIDDGGEWTI
jgi:hypothetical protein